MNPYRHLFSLASLKNVLYFSCIAALMTGMAWGVRLWIFDLRRDNFRNDPIPFFTPAADNTAVQFDLEFDKNIRKTLRTEARERFYRELERKKCAVVASSSNLVGAGYGPLIDSYDVVWRMNQAPVEKQFAADVGTKTTVRMINYMIDEKGVRDIDPASLTQFLIVRELMLQPSEVQYTLANLHGILKVYSENILFLNAWKHNRIMVRISGRSIDRVFPSMGLASMFMALNLCDSVDLFGYGPDKDGKMGYYYDKELYPGGHSREEEKLKKKFDMHAPRLQEIYLKKLESEGIIRLFRGNAEPGFRARP